MGGGVVWRGAVVGGGVVGGGVVGGTVVGGAIVGGTVVGGALLGGAVVGGLVVGPAETVGRSAWDDAATGTTVMTGAGPFPPCPPWPGPLPGEAAPPPGAAGEVPDCPPPFGLR